MIEVTHAYKDAVYAPVRTTAAKVTFEVLDNEAYGDCTAVASSEAPISRLQQINNKQRAMTHPYATFERDYFKLDGSFHIPPRVGEGDSELGWWSKDLCGADGVFQPAQMLTWTFKEEHNAMGLTIYFDVDEYATDFDIDVYGKDGARVAHEAVTGNTKTPYVWIHGLDNYQKIILTIRTWCKPYRRARITEIDFGVIKEYGGDKLIKLNVVEQLNVVGDTLPANELKFTVENADKEFNILNPTGFYRFLKQRQEVKTSIGVVTSNGIEYIHMQRYYLVDWQSDEGALTATFTARNLLELLEQKSYTPVPVSNLYALAEDVLHKAGVPEYDIDDGLRQIATTGFTKSVTSRKALQYIGIAAQCAVYQDRAGVLKLQRFTILDAQTTYVTYLGTDLFCGFAYPAVDKGYDMKHISLDNVYEVPQIKLDKLVQSLTMAIYKGKEKEEKMYMNVDVKEGVNLKCDNPLIQDEQIAANVAKWILAESNLRALYTVNWRQNPCLECGDIVLVEDGFGSKQQSRITRQEFEFTGYLSGKTETKGGV